MLCQAFGVSCRTYYHAKNTKKYNHKEGVLTELEKLVFEVFIDNRRVYGARKISVYIKRYHNRGVSKNTVRLHLQQQIRLHRFYR